VFTIVGSYIPAAVFVVTIVFLLPRLMPGDPLAAREDPSSGLYIYDNAARAKYEAYYGLDHPLPSQFAHYLWSIAHGNLGWSITRSESVSSLIEARLPWTLLLLGSAICFSAVLGYLGGIAAAWRRGRLTDRGLVVLTTAVRAVPEYAWAPILLVLFAVVVPIFPFSAAKTPFAHYGSVFAEVADVLRHLVLPAFALSLGMAAGKFLLVRNTSVSVLGQDFMLLARAKGLPDRVLKYRHAGRNVLLPLLTLIGIQFGFAVGGAVFVESTFAYPGMGSLILQAVNDRDYPVLEGCFLTLAATVLLANIAVDLLYARIDPRAA
jgi:peptide/nickel transport system permease protein